MNFRETLCSSLPCNAFLEPKVVWSCLQKHQLCDQVTNMLENVCIPFTSQRKAWMMFRRDFFVPFPCCCLFLGWFSVARMERLYTSNPVGKRNCLKQSGSFLPSHPPKKMNELVNDLHCCCCSCACFFLIVFCFCNVFVIVLVLVVLVVLVFLFFFFFFLLLLLLLFLFLFQGCLDCVDGKPPSWSGLRPNFAETMFFCWWVI